jgi:hypothetical protein
MEHSNGQVEGDPILKIPCVYVHLESQSLRDMLIEDELLLGGTKLLDDVVTLLNQNITSEKDESDDRGSNEEGCSLTPLI